MANSIIPRKATLSSHLCLSPHGGRLGRPAIYSGARVRTAPKQQRRQHRHPTLDPMRTHRRRFNRLWREYECLCLSGRQRWRPTDGAAE